MDDLSFVQIAFMFEQNEVLIFQLYLIFVIIFLIPICYIVMIEVFKLLTMNRLSNILVPLDKCENLIKDQVLSLAKVYIDKKQWLFCILMLEFYSQIDTLNVAEYYNSIGFCYQLINLNRLAKEYYIKAIRISPTNILFLKNLAKINYICKDFQASLDVYNKILLLDSKNQIALSNIKLLTRYIK